jgi:thiol-disulfide isomerase/thioredoxin
VPSLIVVVALAVGVAVVFRLRANVPPPLAPGEPAPAFALPSLDGDASVTLAGQRGHVVLLNFWATWCGPCEAEMPSMERLHARLRGEPFALLAVSVAKERDAIEAFRKRLGLSFPILLDPDEAVAHRYQTTGFPESLLIDAEGRVVERYVGPRAWDDPLYLERIRSLIDARGTAG